MTEVKRVTAQSKKLAIAGILLCITWLPALPAQQRDERPNFVFVLVDDFGWMDVGYNGSTFYETPRIDAFAAKGVRFNRAYASSPMCSPTRVSIMTGKSPARTGVTQYISGWRSSKFKYIAPLTKLYMTRREKTLGEAFQQHGYDTAFMGKWHMGNFTHGRPEDHGFDFSRAVIESNRCSMYFPFRGVQYFDDQKEGDYFTDKLTDEAIKYLQRQAGAGEPFLLYLAHFSMHAPIGSKPDLRRKYERKLDRLTPPSVDSIGAPERFNHKNVKSRQDDPEYAGELENLDYNFGRVLDALEEFDLDENTVVVLTGDNGGRSSMWEKFPHPTSVKPLRGGKTLVFEGGIRVPTVVYRPRAAKLGTQIDVPIISADFYPTLLEMAGLPLEEQQHLDGVSIAPLIEGRTIGERNLYWHFPHYQGEGGYPASAVFDGKYKLIHNYHFEEYSLFDVVVDPYERNNLAADRPGIVERLKRDLNARLQGVGAQLPVKNTSADIIDEIDEEHRDR